LPLSEHFQDRNIFDKMQGPGMNAEFQTRSDISLVKQSEIFNVQILETLLTIAITFLAVAADFVH